MDTTPTGATPPEVITSLLRDNVRNFLLIRHGQKEVRPEKDAPEAPLTEVGREQARRLGERLQGLPLRAILSSDLQRARETVDQVRQHHPDVPYEMREELREIREMTWHTHFEDWPKDELARRKEAGQKVLAVADELKATYREGEVVAIIAHGNFHRALIGCLGGQDPFVTIPVKMHNASITLVQVPAHGSPWIMLANDVSHLPPALINAHP
ncbi:MAG: histidine phosphatase family protein [Opitutales bacterium]|nr:histidine phosphatase family protein [Opitutales bacterium]